jgi:hypothetical protein
MVRKKNGKWQMCNDFIGLNKCCPKDDFPLSRIGKIVDPAIGCEMMALLDCFSSNHQIWIRKEDEEKTNFMTPFRTYCYVWMPEGLRNADPTFCRMIKIVLKDQMDRNIFTYVDDIVVVSKRKKCTYHWCDWNIRKYMSEACLKLNPDKCVFRVFRGKVFGCLISLKGIEMKPLQLRRDFQNLSVKIAALNRFIVKLAEWILPFFAVLRGSTTFGWGPD